MLGTHSTGMLSVRGVSTGKSAQYRHSFESIATGYCKVQEKQLSAYGRTDSGKTDLAAWELPANTHVKSHFAQ